MRAFIKPLTSKCFQAIILCCVLLTAFAVQAATVTVTNSNDNGPGSLRDAINSASSGDIIVFDGSTNGNPIVLETDLTIAEDVTIIGNDTANTIIDGDDSYQIKIENYTVTLKKLKMQNGSAGFGGGGIHADGSTLTMDSCVVRNCVANFYGGGVYIEYTDATITNSVVAGNTSTKSHGGGLYTDAGTLTMHQTVVHGNSASRDGGAIYSYETVLNLNHSTFSNNDARDGGGLFIYYPVSYTHLRAHET